MARPKESRDKAVRQTAARKQAAAAASLGITPLELMLEVMRTHYAAGDLDKAVAVAERAAPYVHARLARVDASIQTDATHRFVIMGTTEAPDMVTWEKWAQMGVNAEVSARTKAIESERGRTDST